MVLHPIVVAILAGDAMDRLAELAGHGVPAHVRPVEPCPARARRRAYGRPRRAIRS
jgi:hypothetical protein